MLFRLLLIVIFFSVSGDVRADVTSGLLGWWKLDEASGTSAFDSSGNGNTGTLTNGPTWVKGIKGSGLNFDGSNDYLLAGSGVSLDSSNWTMSIWLKPTSISAYVRYFSYYGNGPTFWSFNSAMSIVHSGTIDFNMNITIVAGVWQHIVVARSGSTITAYLNGNQTAQNTSFAVTYTNDTTVRIGNSTAYNEPYNGVADDVRIYNRGLTAQEVQAVYLFGLGRNNLIGSSKINNMRIY